MIERVVVCCFSPSSSSLKALVPQNRRRRRRRLFFSKSEDERCSRSASFSSSFSSSSSTSSSRSRTTGCCSNQSRAHDDDDDDYNAQNKQTNERKKEKNLFLVCGTILKETCLFCVLFLLPVLCLFFSVEFFFLPLLVIYLIYRGVAFRVLKRLEKEGECFNTESERRIRDLGEDSGERTHNDDGRLVLLRRATRKFFTPAQKRVAGRNTLEEKWYAM